MEKQIITEIDRIKEIMKLTVISESVGPARQILNKIFSYFWESGDNYRFFRKPNRERL